MINQAIWFLCVLGGHAGALFALPFLVPNILLSSNRRADLQMIALLLPIGVLRDSILQGIGFFSFTWTGFPIPFWLAVIWAALAFLPHHSLAWMKKGQLVSALFGALGGPLPIGLEFNLELPPCTGLFFLHWHFLQ